MPPMAGNPDPLAGEPIGRPQSFAVLAVAFALHRGEVARHHFANQRLERGLVAASPRTFLSRLAASPTSLIMTSAGR